MPHNQSDSPIIDSARAHAQSAREEGRKEGIRPGLC